MNLYLQVLKIYRYKKQLLTCTCMHCIIIMYKHCKYIYIINVQYDIFHLYAYETPVLFFGTLSINGT